MGYWPEGCFRGQTILVIGGTSGIGAGIARAFVAEGARVTVTGATEAEVSAARTNMHEVTAHVLDVRDSEAVKSFVGGMEELHHVVNCAGIIRRGLEHDPEVFDQVIDINLSGTMRVCAAARPLLARTKGTITNTASMLTWFGGPLVPGYAASKGGVAQLTKSLALAYAADGIRVNAIAPGWIATNLTSALQEDPARTEALLSRMAIKRWGRPEDLAGGVLYLASPLASYVTGTILPIDGGYLSA